MTSLLQYPEIYDLLYNDVIDDIALYLRLASGCSTILEYGAGTGRITIPLAENGHEVHAIDNESSMIERLKRKIDSRTSINRKITYELANMADYQAFRQYDCIIIGLTTFNYLLRFTERLTCLKNIANNMHAKGFAIIELLTKNTFPDINAKRALTFVAKLPIAGGQYYEYWRRTTYNSRNKLIKQHRLFRLFDHHKVEIESTQVSWTNRFLELSEMQRLLRLSGLKIDRIYGDCAGNGYHADSPDLFLKISRIANEA